MARRRLFFQFYLFIFIIASIFMLATVWYFYHSVEQTRQTRVEDTLRSSAYLFAALVEEALVLEQAPSLDSLVKDLSEKTGYRYTVINSDGAVIAESDYDREAMDVHRRRPEFREALQGRLGIDRRRSQTLQVPHIYVAVPVWRDRDIIGAVRVAMRAHAGPTIVHYLSVETILVAILLAVLAGFASFYFYRQVGHPLQNINHVVAAYARGELHHRALIEGPKEVAEVAENLNRMSGQVESRIREAVSQRNEQEAMLSSMIEGVLAVDDRERIISMNQAAGEMLEIPDTDTRGRFIQEAIRNPSLLRFVRTILAGESSGLQEITLRQEGEERVVQAQGTVLRGQGNERKGALFVLHDITRLRKLERMRAEFVANVSHELRTPITSIKGFVETLLEGAKDNPDDAAKFLRIIARQADRLTALVNDLLTISRLEQGEESGNIELEKGRILPAIEAALQTCQVKAREKKVTIKVDCDPHLSTRINRQLIEQAMINLVDNAIKNSTAQSTVTVSAYSEDKKVYIKVSDTGCGIASEHLPRLFERFYRVDRARSREMGGTGLGLSIVKHISLVHGGRVHVESEPNAGSTFTIVLPLVTTDGQRDRQA